MVVLLSTFASGIIAGVTWFVSPKVEALRGELARASDTTNTELAALRNQIRTSDERTETKTTTLNDNIRENSGRISENGERIAHVEA